MTTTLLFYQADPKTNKQKILFERPQWRSTYIERHWLTADQGFMLLNMKTGDLRQSIIIPEWEIKDWQEVRA